VECEGRDGTEFVAELWADASVENATESISEKRKTRIIPAAYHSRELTPRADFLSEIWCDTSDLP
jgi:hypothetical protein